MSQQLSFQVFGKLTKFDLCRASSDVVRRASEQKQSFRDFREWMRGQGLWDKEKTPEALAFLGVSTKPAVAISSRSNGLLNASDSAAEAEALFALLRDANLLLLKVVLEALDIETGGRLHSTHELHRMLTSYVYPGRHIPLVDFQAWLVWAEAAQAIRMVGIRWGVGELGKANMEWFRARDVEEILEDEEEEMLEREGESAIPLRVVENDQASHDDVLPDAAQETVPEQVSDNKEVPVGEDTPTQKGPREMIQQGISPDEGATSENGTGGVAPPAVSGMPGGDEVLRWLRGEQVRWAGPKNYSASEVGISIPMGPADEKRWIAEMVTTAVWVAQGIPGDWVQAALAQLQQDGVFRRIANDEGVTAALESVDYYLGNPALLRISGSLVLAAAAMAQLKKQPDILDRIREEADPLQQYEQVHRIFLAEAYPVGAFWWVKQAITQGVWQDES